MKGWQSVQLGDLCDVLDSLRRPITKRDRISGPVPYYGASGVLDHVKDQLFDERLVLLGEDGAKWESGADSAFAISGPAWVNNHAHVLRPRRNKLDDDWLVYYLNFADLRPFVTGLTVPKLNQEMMRSIPIPLPAVAEQQRIVAILDEAFGWIEVAERNARASLDGVGQARVAFEEAAFGTGGRASGPVVQLSEIASFRNGLNYTKTSVGEIVPVVGVADFGNNFSVDFRVLSRVQIDGRLGAADELAEGDILMVRSNGSKSLIGRTMLVGKVQDRVGYSGFVIRVRLHSNEISPEYLCHYLKSSMVRAALVASGAGANISSLSQGALAQLAIRCPSKVEQTAIVRRLEAGQSQLDALAEIYRKKLATLAKLKQSLLTYAFSGKLAAVNEHTFSTPEQSANVIAYLYWRHERARRNLSYRRVKAQKALDLVERIGGVDLGRAPYKDAAGPNDLAHMNEAQAWAKAHGFFEFVRRGDGYEFKKLENYRNRLAAAQADLKPIASQLDRVADILLPKDKEESEVFATVLAAWNNLIADRQEASESAILREARDNWHAEKLRIPVNKFTDAIREIRRLDLAPNGTAKVVRHRQASLL